MKYLLDLTAKADVNCRTGSAGYTPLHLAASNGHDKCVRELLAHGGDIRCVDEHGKTPKQSAEYIFRHSNTIVKILLSEGELRLSVVRNSYSRKY